MRGLFVLLLLILAACGQPTQTSKNWNQNDGKIKVLSTTAMINDLVQHVGGEFVSSQALIQGNLDPHSYQLVKGDDEKLSDADLVIHNGLGLEHGAGLHYFIEHSTKTVSLGDYLLVNHADRLLSVHGQHDPHIWLDLELFSETIPAIVQALQKRDPKHSDSYAENGKKWMEELQKLHKEIKDELQSIPNEKRYLVTSHDAFNYFTRAYLAAPGEAREEWEMRFQAPEGLAPDTQISSADVRQVIDHIGRYQVRVIFPESNVSRDSIKKIVDAATEKGISVHIATEPLYGDAMGPGNYQEMLKHNAQTLKRYLK